MKTTPATIRPAGQYTIQAPAMKVPPPKTSPAAKPQGAAAKRTAKPARAVRPVAKPAKAAKPAAKAKAKGKK